MPRENFSAKARRLLGEGRVIITHVDGRDVRAVVRGDSAEFYSVTHRSGSWACTCPALGRCSHVQALMLVTLPISVAPYPADLVVGGTE
jgi:uncharacterized Zn finger protein